MLQCHRYIFITYGQVAHSFLLKPPLNQAFPIHAQLIAHGWAFTKAHESKTLVPPQLSRRALEMLTSQD